MAFHIRRLLEVEAIPVAIKYPSGLNEAVRTLKLWVNVKITFPVILFHNFAVLSLLAVSTFLHVGAKRYTDYSTWMNKVFDKCSSIAIPQSWCIIIRARQYIDAIRTDHCHIKSITIPHIWLNHCSTIYIHSNTYRSLLAMIIWVPL